jgi:signal transduction histidine kinase
LALVRARVANAWLRLGASAVAALVATSLVETVWPALWYVGLLPVVLIDRSIYMRLLRRNERRPPQNLRWIAAWTLAQSAYGNLLAIVLWFATYVPGETLAVMFLCGALANAATSLRSAPVLALCGMAPTMAMLLGLPLADFLLGGGVNALELAPMVGALLLIGFGINLWRGLIAADEAQAEAEAALLRERQSAAAAAAAKSEVIRRMNDELRTPMAALVGAAEHLRRAAASPQARAHIATLVQAGEVLKLVLDDLSDLDRIETGQLVIDAKPADPRELVRGVVSAFRAAAQDKNLELFLDVAPETPTLVTIDPVRVRQVLFNLLANAVRYTVHGGVRVRMSARPGEEGRVRLSFAVADTGSGLSRSQLALIFGRERIGGEGGGPGLGLAISMKLARAMGGQLTARSELAQGSVFTLTLDAPIVVARSRSAA